MGLNSKHSIRGDYISKKQQNAELQRRVTRLGNAFDRNAFIFVSDQVNDGLNGGKLLRLDFDITQIDLKRSDIPLSSTEIDIAISAVCKKARHSGHSLQSGITPNHVSVTAMAHNR